MVLVHGVAKVNENLEENMNYINDLMSNMKECWKKTVLAKMVKELMSPLAKRLMDWYLYKIIIEVKPQKLLIWRDGNLENSPEALEVAD